jgi:hypothetical protein
MKKEKVYCKECKHLGNVSIVDRNHPLRPCNTYTCHYRNEKEVTDTFYERLITIFDPKIQNARNNCKFYEKKREVKNG